MAGRGEIRIKKYSAACNAACMPRTHTLVVNTQYDGISNLPKEDQETAYAKGYKVY